MENPVNKTESDAVSPEVLKEIELQAQKLNTNVLELVDETKDLTPDEIGKFMYMYEATQLKAITYALDSVLLFATSVGSAVGGGEMLKDAVERNLSISSDNMTIGGVLVSIGAFSSLVAVLNVIQAMKAKKTSDYIGGRLEEDDREYSEKQITIGRVFKEWALSFLRGH